MKNGFRALALTSMFFAATAADAQSFRSGQNVYATPSGASNNWYSGCVVKDGRSNNSYQVECAGTVWWVSADNIRTSPPQAVPDPMRPGHILTPTITPSHAGAAPAATRVAARAPAPARGAAGGNWTGYAPNMARMIARDKAESSPATLRSGKYSCYAGGRYTFSDLYITGPHSYTVKPGGSGSFSYANGALTFQSGPYKGAYSRMVDGHTIGVSAPGNRNLGTQCGFEK
jgi:hypothetical protein